jgi:hypothetical protein
VSLSFWISGQVQSGKTTRLIEQFQTWTSSGTDFPAQTKPKAGMPLPTAKAQATRRSQAILVFADSGDNRLKLNDRLLAASQSQYSINSTTPLSFFEDEVTLFWPLLVQSLSLRATFPLRLRPENEQQLASRLWQSALDAGQFPLPGVSRQRLVRQFLDVLQIAAFSGTPIEEIASRLEAGLIAPELSPQDWDCLKQLLLDWRQWCWQRGLLTYGILTELYWRYLLPLPEYQHHLQQRYRGILADDVDNYPAIAKDLFELLLDQGAVGLFTYNPDGAIRLGLGADPAYLADLSRRCQCETVTWQPTSALDDVAVDELLQTPGLALPESLPSLQTVARSQLLRQVAATISKAVQAGEVQPQEIAVIGPGFDAIARYTLIEILSRHNIPVTTLNDQRPLISSAPVRGLLTLLALAYPGCGRLIESDQVAEMLVVLSGRSAAFGFAVPEGIAAGASEPSSLSPPSTASTFAPRIDPVRAGLLADYCFQPHPQQPRLLPANSFARWDRLGHEATLAYGELWQWLEQQRAGFEQPGQPYLTLSPVFVLDRAIQQFLWPNHLASDQLVALRELMETAQHYWAVSQRLQQTDLQPGAIGETVCQFIELLRAGTITANPFPIRPGRTESAVTLATAFQYRSDRPTHRWQFWLDVGGRLWQGGGAVVLWGAPLFLKQSDRQPSSLQAQTQADDEQLRRLLLDLCRRTSDRIYLCHSDLSVTGQEQMGPLLPWVEAATALPTTV